jgi:hypothetical protein
VGWAGRDDVPGQQAGDAVDGMIGDPGQNFAQISLGIDSVEFRRTTGEVTWPTSILVRASGSGNCWKISRLLISLLCLWGIAARIFHLGWPIDISVRNIDRFVYRDVYRADLRSRGEDGALFPGCSSAHDQQTLCDISLLILRLTSATLSQGVSLS